MGRYTGPRCKLCRREGSKLFLKGDRCYTDKCPMSRRPQPPGQHGRYRRRSSEFAAHLREKQKAKRIYGIQEAQFRRYVDIAKKRKANTGETMIRLLEQRLDNVIYRAGFALSRAQARELASHGHFLVNGRHVDIPSYGLRKGDIVAVKPESRDKLREAIKAASQRPLPSFLTRDLENLRIQMTEEPKLADLEHSIDTSLIVEFYSR